MRKITPSVLILILAVALQAIGQERDRAKIPDKYKWNLADIYPTDVAWRAAKEKIQRDIPALATFKGKLGASAPALADALDRIYSLQKDLSRLRSYASLFADQDTRDSVHQGMRQEMAQVAAQFNAETSYFEPEILRLPKQTIEQFIHSEPRLKPYQFALEDITRRAAH